VGRRPLSHGGERVRRAVCAANSIVTSHVGTIADVGTSLTDLVGCTARHETTPGEAAIAWSLRNPAVDGVIVSFRAPDQADPMVTAANLELTDEDIEQIEGGRDEHDRIHRPGSDGQPHRNAVDR